MKTTVITIITAILGALGTVATAKWAVPPEHISAVIEAVTALIGAGFGIYAAMHVPKSSK